MEEWVGEPKRLVLGFPPNIGLSSQVVDLVAREEAVLLSLDVILAKKCAVVSEFRLTMRGRGLKEK